MKPDYYISAVFELIKTGHWITDKVGVALKEYGISEPQYNVLRVLRGQKGNPITVHEILSHMIQRSSNVTRIIDKLSEKKYVVRHECPTNRRKMDITITKDGLDKLELLDKVVEKFHKPMAKNLSIEEAKQLKSLITKLKKGIAQ
ncbi:MAG: MarR family transcriptional regulator [Reichenbachiella sp.]